MRVKRPATCPGNSPLGPALSRALMLALAFGMSGARGARAQEGDLLLPHDTEPQPVLATQATLPSVLGAEARRYLADGTSILRAPLRWDGTSWAQAAGTLGSLALLSTQDNRIDIAVQRHRSRTTNSISRAVTPLGSYAGVGVSVASLGAGLLFHDAPLRDTGRDAIEAEILAAGIVTPVLKTVFGRERPIQGSDADEFRPLSGRQSFPSGHSTEAFAVASVIAARSEGWVVPVAAYTLASGVAFARMNDRAHFASDVFAGAVIGTAIGRSIVHRHNPEEGNAGSWSLVPLASRRGGVGVGFHFGAKS